MSVENMDCHRFRPQLDLWLDAVDATLPQGLSPLSAEDVLAIEEHVAACDACSKLVSESRALGEELRRLPRLTGPQIDLSNQRCEKSRDHRPEPVRSGISPTRTRRVPASVRTRPRLRGVLFFAAVVLVAVTVSIWTANSSFRERPQNSHANAVPVDARAFEPIGNRRVASQSPENWWSRGARVVAARGDVVLPGGATARLSTGTEFRIADGQLSILEGRVGLAATAGQSVTVRTKAAAVDVSAAVCWLDVKPASSLARNSQETDPMNSNLVAVPVAAVVSVFVSLGTVSIYNSMGKVDVDSDQFAQVLEKGAPELIDLPESVQGLREELASARETVRRLESRIEERDDSLEAKLVARLDEQIAAKVAASGTEGDGETPEKPEKSAEEVALEAEDLFEDLTSVGLQILSSRRLGKLADFVRQMGPEGKAWVSSELVSDDSKRRIVAAALASKLEDGEYIPGLVSAIDDFQDVIPRRFASHALMSLGDERAGDDLARIVENETRDNGVQLNAWFGLASLGREEAVPLFEKVLSRAGGQITPDFVVDSALKISEPVVLPALRKAYDHEGVSVAMRTMVLHRLADSETGEFDGFLRQVAADSEADENLRAAAREALDE